MPFLTYYNVSIHSRHRPVSCRGENPELYLERLRVSENTHGTGCTLSAAIATGLGSGLPLRVAVTKAQEYLNLALRRSYNPGKGIGPPNHMAK